MNPDRLNMVSVHNRMITPLIKQWPTQWKPTHRLQPNPNSCNNSRQTTVHESLKPFHVSYIKAGNEFAIPTSLLGTLQ